jgi:hypothetical protein
MVDVGAKQVMDWLYLENACCECPGGGLLRTHANDPAEVKNE